jgi:hypothetical protein
MALTINRLGWRDVADMIDRVVGNKLLPAEIRQDIIECTDGIPLFVEEMTKAVLEAESVRTNSSLIIWIGWSDRIRPNIRLMSIVLRFITLIAYRCR